MSLLLERARQSIREFKSAEEEKWRTEERDRMQQQQAEEARIEKVNVMKLASHMRFQSTELLRKYGIFSPDLKGIHKAKVVLGSQNRDKVLRVTLDENGEEPVEILIESFRKQLLIGIGGLRARLELSKTGPILHKNGLLGYSFLKEDEKNKVGNINLGDLTEYQDVLNKVERKLNPLPQPSSSHRAP